MGWAFPQQSSSRCSTTHDASRATTAKRRWQVKVQDDALARSHKRICGPTVALTAPPHCSGRIPQQRLTFTNPKPRSLQDSSRREGLPPPSRNFEREEGGARREGDGRATAAAANNGDCESNGSLLIFPSSAAVASFLPPFLNNAGVQLGNGVRTPCLPPWLIRLFLRAPCHI